MVPTSVLKRAREDAKVRQAEMGARLGVSGSVVSRLEKAEQTDSAMARRYLDALGTPMSLAVSEFYGREWTLSERPQFDHPDRDELWAAERALQALRRFEESDEYDALLAAPLALIRTNLLGASDFVRGVDHSIAWIGSVGVGKTTALSYLTGLTIEGRDGRPVPVFPASGGRTTVSEVVLRVAPAYAISIEPRSDDEVRQLVGEMVSATVKASGGISTELDRAIRNMADLRKHRAPDDPRTLVDPIRDLLARKGADEADVVEAIVDRMNLGHRTETQLILSESAEGGLRWLSENITRINFGQHPRFSIPQRVTVFLPEGAMRRSRYNLSVIDTKGLHGTTARPDLQAHSDDPRTLFIVCCSFNDAPGAEPLKLLQGLKAVGTDAFDKGRVLLLALPRADEAMKVVDDSGEPVDSAESGYAVRGGQVEDSLAEAELPRVPVAFFNAMTEDPSSVWKQISGRIEAMRRRQVERLQRFVGLSDDLITNADAARIRQAREAIAAEAAAMVHDYNQVPSLLRPAHQTLVEEIEGTHPSTIAASIARRGSWENLDVHHLVGFGVRIDANRRTGELRVRMDGRLEGLLRRFRNVPEALALIETLREDLEDWHQDFLGKALTIGRAAFKPHLDRSEDLWEKLLDQYGDGRGYRRRIGEILTEWFETSPGLDDARRRVDVRLRDAWRELVLGRLIAATALTGDGQGAD